MKIRLLASFLALVMLAAACSSTDDDPAPGGATSTDGNGEEDRSGGVLNIGLAGEPPHPIMGPNTSVLLYQWLANVYSFLVRYDDDGEWIPDLAERWELSDDGNVFTFYLRDNAVWHDGEPFTAEDVKFTFENILVLGQWRDVWEAATITVIDPTTIEFDLPERSGLAPTIFTDYQAPIYPRHLLEGHTDSLESILETDFASHPIGTGPFEFVEWLPEERITLARNESYFKETPPHLDQLVFHILPSVEGRISALEFGQIDYLGLDVPLNEVERLQDSDEIEVEVGDPVSGRHYQLFVNHTHPAMADVRVRQAITHAIDRERIIDRAQFGFGEVEHLPLMNSRSPQAAQLTDADIVEYDYDPERARELLDEAGIESLDLELLIETTITGNLDIAALIQDDLSQVGINTTQVRVDTPTAQDLVYQRYGEFELYLVRLITFKSPVLEMQSRVHSDFIRAGQSLNAVSFADDDLDALYDAASSTGDPEARLDLEKQILEIESQLLPYIPLITEPGARAWRTDVQDLPTMGLFAPNFEATWVSR